MVKNTIQLKTELQTECQYSLKVKRSSVNKSDYGIENQIMELKTQLWNFIPNNYNTINRIKSVVGGVEV